MMNRRVTLTAAASTLALGNCLLFTPAVSAQQAPALPPLVNVPAGDSHAVATVSDVVFSAAGKTVLPTETVSWIFPHAPKSGDGQFAVLAGVEDVSPNCRWVSLTQLDCVFDAMPLPSGTLEMKFFAISFDNQWVEIAKAILNVLAPIEQSQPIQVRPGVFSPSLIVGAKSQAYEDHSASAFPPNRPTYLDGTLQAGLQTENYGDTWSAKSQFNVVGSTYQPEAVNFGAQGSNAPQIDVANYLIGATVQGPLGLSEFSLGNVQTGNNPLLANGIGNRGALLRQKINNRFDISAAVQNGTSIVGASNFFGLADNEHRMSTLSLGAELLERAGGIRMEATMFQGMVKPVLTGNVATLQDAEQSTGTGLRFTTQNVEGSLRGDFAFARSSYTPRGDSLLNIPAGPKVVANAWYGDLTYDLLRNVPMSPEYPFSLSVQAKREFADFGYKSIGAGQGNDYISDALNLNASLGVINGQLQLGQRVDNVNDSSAFLKNRSRTSNLSLAMPLGQIINAVKPPVWAPTISMNHGVYRTLADTDFIPLGQTIANLPHTTTNASGLSLNWTIDTVALGYNFSRNFQDNQQVGSEAMDALDTSHTVSLSYPINDQVSVNHSFGVREAKQLDTGLINRGDTAQLGLNWVMRDRYALSSNASYSFDRDSFNTMNNKVLQLQLQLLKQFDISSFSKQMPAQWSMSYSRSQTNSMGTQVRYETINAALSLSFF